MLMDTDVIDAINKQAECIYIVTSGKIISIIVLFKTST